MSQMPISLSPSVCAGSRRNVSMSMRYLTPVTLAETERVPTLSTYSRPGSSGCSLIQIKWVSN